MMLAMAVGGGFLLVCTCVGCIRALSQLTEQRERYSAVPHGQNANGDAPEEQEEQEREQILAEVYGRATDGIHGEEGGIPGSHSKDDVLNRAWAAIEQAASSDDEDLERLVSEENYTPKGLVEDMSFRTAVVEPGAAGGD